VLQLHHLAQRSLDTLLLVAEQLRPARVVLGQLDRRVVRRRLADPRGPDLLLGHRRMNFGVRHRAGHPSNRLTK